jgi:hypothetical protein
MTSKNRNDEGQKGMREKGSQNYSTTTQLFTHVGFGVELLKKFLLAVGKN